ncbi:MAG: hypothetical protein JHC95_14450 [Solirubrobacteraceae bacterium]|nr:hypothetical protein [Solirubrobacteraceae bacterium]
MVPAVPPEFAPVEVDRVVWSPTGPDTGTVEVVIEGRWRGAPLPTTPLLLVEEAGLRRRFGARGEQLPSVAGSFSASFTLPARLRDELQAGAALRMGAAEMALPAARIGATVGGGADVIEPSVLMDRRARREEPAILAEKIEVERAARARAEAERDALAEEVAAVKAAVPASGLELDELRRLRTRVDDLNDALVALAGELRVRLRDEAAARWVAEAELRTERAHVGALSAELSTLRDGKRAEPAAQVERALPPAYAPPPEVDATIANLGRAADRLRERAEHLAADAEQTPGPVAEPQQEPVATPPPAAAVHPPVPSPLDDDPAALAEVVDAFGVTIEQDAIVPDAEPELAAVEPLPDPAGPRVERVVELAPRIVHDHVFTFWLTNAIEKLDAVDREAAADSVVALLPLQGPAMRRKLAYDLTVEPGGARRIVLGKRTFAMEDRFDGDEQPKPDVAVSGTPGNLAPLVAGGALRGVSLEVSGRKRKLKKLARARRRPVTLGDVVRAEVPFDCGLALKLLAVSVSPEWTSGYVFHVAYRVGEDDHETWVIDVADGRPLTVEARDSPTATATVEAPSCAGLLAHLTRTEPPAEGPTTVAGDFAAAASLARWFDRAQGFKIL